MLNPLQRLKYLPWIPLLQASGITVLLLIVVDLTLLWLYLQVGAIQDVIQALLAPPLGTLVTFAAMMGIGALAVLLLEGLFPQVIISVGVLWALVPCVALLLFLWSISPIPAFIFGGSGIQIIAIALGIFVKGRPYWR